MKQSSIITSNNKEDAAKQLLTDNHHQHSSSSALPFDLYIQTLLKDFLPQIPFTRRQKIELSVIATLQSVACFCAYVGSSYASDAANERFNSRIPAPLFSFMCNVFLNSLYNLGITTVIIDHVFASKEFKQLCQDSYRNYSAFNISLAAMSLGPAVLASLGNIAQAKKYPALHSDWYQSIVDSPALPLIVIPAFTALNSFAGYSIIQSIISLLKPFYVDGLAIFTQRAKFTSLAHQEVHAKTIKHFDYLLSKYARVANDPQVAHASFALNAELQNINYASPNYEQAIAFHERLFLLYLAINNALEPALSSGQQRFKDLLNNSFLRGTFNSAIFLTIVFSSLGWFKNIYAQNPPEVAIAIIAVIVFLNKKFSESYAGIFDVLYNTPQFFMRNNNHRWLALLVTSMIASLTIAALTSFGPVQTSKDMLKDNAAWLQTLGEIAGYAGTTLANASPMVASVGLIGLSWLAKKGRQLNEQKQFYKNAAIEDILQRHVNFYKRLDARAANAVMLGENASDNLSNSKMSLFLPPSLVELLNIVKQKPSQLLKSLNIPSRKDGVIAVLNRSSWVAAMAGINELFTTDEFSIDDPSGMFTSIIQRSVCFFAFCALTLGGTAAYYHYFKTSKSQIEEVDEETPSTYGALTNHPAPSPTIIRNDSASSCLPTPYNNDSVRSPISSPEGTYEVTITDLVPAQSDGMLPTWSHVTETTSSCSLRAQSDSSCSNETPTNVPDKSLFNYAKRFTTATIRDSLNGIKLAFLTTFILKLCECDSESSVMLGMYVAVAALSNNLNSYLAKAQATPPLVAANNAAFFASQPRYSPSASPVENDSARNRSDSSSESEKKRVV